MMQDDQSGPSPDEPAEGANNAPPPDKGSPQPAQEDVEGPNDKDDGNPLAPPVNTGAGS